MDTSYDAASGDKAYKFLAEQLANGVLAPVARIVHGPQGAPVPVDPAHPLPVADAALVQALAGLATAAGQAAMLAVLQAVGAAVDGVESGLGSILGKLSNDPATATAQAAELVKLTSIDSKMPVLVSGLAPVRIGGSAIALDLVADSAGTLFSPGASSHTYGYDGSGNLTTDTAVLAGVTRVKTFGWASGRIATESQWVVA